MTNPKKPRKACKRCGEETGLPRAIFCSNQCQRDFEYYDYLAKWKKGEVSGGVIGASVSNYVLRYLTERDGQQCAECGWARIHPITGKVPLQVHHINGNPDDHREENLQLLCPNCHSLTFSYGGLNRGHGRSNRYKKDTPA